MQRRQQHNPRIPLRDRVDPVTVEVTSHILNACIFTAAVTARMPQLLAAAAIVLGVQWALRHDDEPVQRATQDADTATTARRSDVALQQVGSLSDEDFDALLDEVDRQARSPAPIDVAHAEHLGSLGEIEFQMLVRDALDELPEFVLRELEEQNIAVTVSDAGHEWHAYGLYVGGSLAYDDWASQILIFRDTLTRDFGADRDELRKQVIRVVRHEVAHHLGAGERHVRDLGL